jgi:hypothetical protein
VVVGVGQENREFVTAEADEQVLVAQAGVQSSGDNAQQFVSCGVAQRVIDVFEIVEIQEQQCR